MKLCKSHRKFYGTLKIPGFIIKFKKKNAWEEIAAELHTTVDECKKKMNALLSAPKLILQSDKLKTSTLRPIYPTSMLKTKLNIKKNIDINQYSRLRAFLRFFVKRSASFITIFR
jgi:predicted nuclease of restriction endonuclease-like RecB superfamily